MTKATPQQLIDQLDTLLEKEREALLVGDLDKVTEIAVSKEELIDALNRLSPKDQTSLEALQEKVTRNQVLLDGALQGIRKVASRLAALRRIRKSMDTYDASGRKQTIQGEVDRRMEKRA